MRAIACRARGVQPPDGVGAHVSRESSAAHRAQRASSPWQLGGLTARQLAVRVWNEAWADEVMDRAAALSYYLLFSVFPALLFMTALLGLLPSPNLMDRLIVYLDRVLPPDAASLLRKTLAEILRGAAGSVLSVGALTALWAASAGMISVINALDIAYDVEDRRPWWRRRLVAVALTLVFMLFTVTALVFLVLGPRLAEALAARLGLGPLFALAWRLLEWPVAGLVVLTGLALVYYLAPAKQQAWRWVTPGSVFALVAWLLGSAGLRLYVQHVANYNATYGSIGAVILLLLWLYLSGLALLVGAEIDAEIEHAAAERGAPGAVEPGRAA